VSSGELIKNGGMEHFTGNIPNDWVTASPDAISHNVQSGAVHTGESAVSIAGGGDLSQIVHVFEGCFYELAFFVRGEGERIGLTAEVTFITEIGGAPALASGLRIAVRQQDLPSGTGNFGFYRGITTRAPEGATSAEIRFDVTGENEQHLDLDDVSFIFS
jgi:hypothetical protein